MGAKAKLVRTSIASGVRSNLLNKFFMLDLLYFAFTGTISIFVEPLGGANAKTESGNVGFKSQCNRETDCGRASSARLVMTILRGSGLPPADIQICQSISP